MLAMHKSILSALMLLAFAACSPPSQPEAAAPAAAPPADARVVTAKPASAGEQLKVTAPAPGARLQSGFIAEGSAPGFWYFEAVFPITLVDEAGAVLAEAPGQAVDDWMTAGPVRFRTPVAFKVTGETKAWLVFTKDNETGEAENDGEVRVPVVLVP